MLEQLEKLLHDCKEVQKGFVHKGKNWLDIDEYDVDHDLARKFLPMVPEKAYFGDETVYGTRYTMVVINVIETVEKILATTDFETQAVYINAALYQL